MRECTDTDGSTTTGWAQPPCTKPRPSMPIKARDLENDELNWKSMTKFLCWRWLFLKAGSLRL
jgi:hypothetical protein